MLSTYYRLTKPGIIKGNLLTTAAGFFLGSQGHIQLATLLAILVGTSLVIASACVFNNYIDRDVDKIMARTKKRAIPSGLVKPRDAIIYGIILGLFGFLVLALYTNWLTFTLGIVAMFSYVIVYGIAKRRSVHGTLVGSISGALPPVAGYAAATNNLDLAALLLFLILVFWQMPHFYAIAIFRMSEYKAAKIPVLPIVKGYKNTKNQILFYMLGFVTVSSLLTVFGYASYVYLLAMLLISTKWLHLSIRGFNTNQNEKWARSVFGFSLIVLLAFSTIVSLDSLLR